MSHGGLHPTAALASCAAAVTVCSVLLLPLPATARPVDSVGTVETGPSDLAWSDEFNGPAGARPSPTRWTYNVGGGRQGWSHGELEYYTSSARNAATDGRGHLGVTARRLGPGTHLQCWYGKCRYTSARMMTLDRFHFRYGRVEARINLPVGAGLWPALWALDVNNVRLPSDPAYAEMDIMEHVGSEPNAVVASLHGRRGGATMKACTQYHAKAGQRLEGAFHVYAADWDTSKVTFSIDGARYVTRYRSSYGSAWTFDQNLFLVLNLAVGGAWPGTPTAQTRFPATMLVDYVRVYSRPATAVAATPPRPPTHPGGCDLA